ncbi:MAG TPA: GNAT family protein [Pyrinomonadaceae bacterium]|jgi:RimJ/RimL family protein N-acetyltransferase|nr:GNAT family protein [Pyrinomonadaceae bacterium]
MKFAFTQMNEADAREVLAWIYEPPYDFYNSEPAELEKNVELVTDRQNMYYALRNESGELIAYYCFGREAQIDGGEYAPGAVDIGGGLRPDLTGNGFGPTFIQVGLDFASILFGPNTIRATVAAFNLRALKMCENAGFESEQRFRGAKDMEFVILTNRDASAE